MFDNDLFKQRLKDFKPESLVVSSRLESGSKETLMVCEHNDNIDLAKVNYLNFLDNEKIKKTSEEAIRKYGVGTCGPRAFYGTTDVHMELEKRLAKFMHMEDSLLCSSGYMAVSSTVSTFLKPNDVAFVDELTNSPIEHGLLSSNCKIVKFAHNNSEDFNAKLQAQLRKETQKTRKYLLLEAISWQTGALCHLNDFLKVAESFKVRVLLDESYSLGILGASGRGLLEHFCVDSSRVDAVFGTFEGALGGYGGFSATTYLPTMTQIKFHGLGYSYSASLPTFSVMSTMKALELLGDKPRRFRELAKSFHEFLEECGFNVISDIEAPFKIVVINPKSKQREVHRFCKKNKVHFSCNDIGLVLQLNINILEGEKAERLKRVLKEASKLLE